MWLADFDKFDEERFSNLSQTPGVNERNPSWSPQGNLVAWAAIQSNNHSIHTWDAASGPRYIGSGDWPVWSPDGSTILTSLEDANQTQLTAYGSIDGHLELPPVILPGGVAGLTWIDKKLPLPLPQNLQQISAEVQSLPWLVSNTEDQANLVRLAGVQAPFPELLVKSLDVYER